MVTMMAHLQGGAWPSHSRCVQAGEEDLLGALLEALQQAHGLGGKQAPGIHMARVRFTCTPASVMMQQQHLDHSPHSQHVCRQGKGISQGCNKCCQRRMAWEASRRQGCWASHTLGREQRRW